MLANVNATRMELLNLRKRVALAARGHRLLSEKRDEISRNLIKIARQIPELRKTVEKQLLAACRRFMLARTLVEPEDVKAALEIPTKKFSLAIKFASIMSVKIPEFTKQSEGRAICYGYLVTPAEMDVALTELEKVFDMLVKLAEKQKQAYLLATELQSTRRRVNVLEHIVIPELNRTIRFIFDKLAEVDRDNTSRLMKIADIIRA